MHSRPKEPAVLRALAVLEGPTRWLRLDPPPCTSHTIRPAEAAPVTAPTALPPLAPPSRHHPVQRAPQTTCDPPADASCAPPPCCSPPRSPPPLLRLPPPPPEPRRARTSIAGPATERATRTSPTSAARWGVGSGLDHGGLHGPGLQAQRGRHGSTHDALHPARWRRLPLRRSASCWPRMPGSRLGTYSAPERPATR